MKPAENLIQAWRQSANQFRCYGQAAAADVLERGAQDLVTMLEELSLESAASYSGLTLLAVSAHLTRARDHLTASGLVNA